jgi:hypothetical protein
VLADSDEVAEVNRALTHGVRGYIPTSVEWEVAVAALRLISAGGTFVPADALRSTTAKLDDQPEGERQRRSDGRDLTPRELSVIDLLREGKPNRLIAAQLDMQEQASRGEQISASQACKGLKLDHADFSGANLHKADLAGASLWGAQLSGACLGDAVGLTDDQLKNAHLA